MGDGPPKREAIEDPADIADEAAAAEGAPKRGRGRPRKDGTPTGSARPAGKTGAARPAKKIFTGGCDESCADGGCKDFTIEEIYASGLMVAVALYGVGWDDPPLIEADPVTKLPIMKGPDAPYPHLLFWAAAQLGAWNQMKHFLRKIMTWALAVSATLTIFGPTIFKGIKKSFFTKPAQPAPNSRTDAVASEPVGDGTDNGIQGEAL